MQNHMWWNIHIARCNIIELVDSYVGIAQTCNIWQYKKIAQNLINGKLISLYNNVPFIFECFHDEQHTQWRQKALRKYRTRKSPDGQNVFLSSSSSSDRLVQTCVTLSRWFSHKTAVHQPIHFFPVLSLTRRFELLTEELWLPLQRHFFFTCKHAHKSLSNERLLN